MPSFIRITAHYWKVYLRDSAYEFLDDINTPEKETLSQDVTLAFKEAAAACKKLDHDGKLTWGKLKATEIRASCQTRLHSAGSILIMSGGEYAINALKNIMDRAGE